MQKNKTFKTIPFSDMKRNGRLSTSKSFYFPSAQLNNGLRKEGLFFSLTVVWTGIWQENKGEFQYIDF